MVETKSYKFYNVASGNLPGPRAAHGAVCVDKNKLIIFGGASKSGLLASNELYQLNVEDELQSSWSILTCKKENRPSKRYGHVMLYFKPYIIIFGGNMKNNIPNNDLWIANISQEELEWKQAVLRNISLKPIPRVYSSGDICRSGKSNGMIIIFGGRDLNQNPLNDSWGLRRHRDGTWDWLQAPIKNEYTPLTRYQVIHHFILAFYFVLWIYVYNFRWKRRK